MIPLTENDEHVQTRKWIASQLPNLGFSVFEEYEFTVLGFFGYSPTGITEKIRNISWTLRRATAQAKYISPQINDIAIYHHKFDIFYEKISKSSYSLKPLKFRGVIEIDGEYHDPDVDLKRATRQIVNDKLAELTFSMWFEEPKEFTRVRKEHVIIVMEDSLDVQICFIEQFMIKGKYRELDCYRMDADKFLECVATT